MSWGPWAFHLKELKSISVWSFFIVVVGFETFRLHRELGNISSKFEFERKIYERYIAAMLHFTFEIIQSESSLLVSFSLFEFIQRVHWLSLALNILNDVNILSSANCNFSYDLFIIYACLPKKKIRIGIRRVNWMCRYQTILTCVMCLYTCFLRSF